MPNGCSKAGDLSPEDVDAARAGDRRAASRLTAVLLPRARNLVRYLIRGDADVDDVVQEALVAVLRGLAGYRGDGTFRSWADRVVARSTFAWLGRRRTGQRQLQACLECTTGHEPVSTEDEYLVRRRVATALDQLPFEQRHALVLHHVLEMSVPEIAEETRAPAETVRSRLRLGRLRLRDLLRSSTSDQKVS